MLATLLLFKCFSSRNKEGKYIGHFMLAFTLYWVIIYAYDYSPMKDKYIRVYVSSSGILQRYNLLIQMSKRWEKYPTLHV